MFFHGTATSAAEEAEKTTRISTRSRRSSRRHGRTTIGGRTRPGSCTQEPTSSGSLSATAATSSWRARFEPEQEAGAGAEEEEREQETGRARCVPRQLQARPLPRLGAARRARRLRHAADGQPEAPQEEARADALRRRPDFLGSYYNFGVAIYLGAFDGRGKTESFERGVHAERERVHAATRRRRPGGRGGGDGGSAAADAAAAAERAAAKGGSGGGTGDGDDQDAPDPLLGLHEGPRRAAQVHAAVFAAADEAWFSPGPSGDSSRSRSGNNKLRRRCRRQRPTTACVSSSPGASRIRSLGPRRRPGSCSTRLSRLSTVPVAQTSPGPCESTFSTAATLPRSTLYDTCSQKTA